MWPAFEQLKVRFAELETLLGDPDVIGDRNRYTKLAKEHGSVSKMLKPYDDYLKVAADLANAEAMLADPEQ
ncbi:MAG: PCRF domain-containing protein, partial [Planctomycetota bacterium]